MMTFLSLDYLSCFFQLSFIIWSDIKSNISKMYAYSFLFLFMENIQYSYVLFNINILVLKFPNLNKTTLIRPIDCIQKATFILVILIIWNNLVYFMLLFSINKLLCQQGLEYIDWISWREVRPSQKEVSWVWH